MHIILYVCDALRADHLGCYGYERQTSPTIDSLANDGVVFENCFTSSTWTRPTAASILTGTYPGVHLTSSRSDAFSTKLARLPEILKLNGFKTSAFSTMGNIASDLGFDRGFDQYLDLFRMPEILAKRRHLSAAKEGLNHAEDEEIALPRAEDINDYLTGWLDENRAENTFSFAWSIETHAPYTVPDEFRKFSDPGNRRPGEGEREDLRNAGAEDRQRLIDLYDESIYYNDYCIGQIVERLKAMGLYDETLFIVIGDHGDAFFEHGFYAHGHTPFEELIHVPMVVKFPGGKHGGSRVEALVELIDLFPTLVAAAGLTLDASVAPYVQGHNLLSLVEGRANGVREYAFSDTRSLSIHNHYLSVRDTRWKYIKVQKPESGQPAVVGLFKHAVERGMLWEIVRSPRPFIRKFLSKKPSEMLFDLESDPAEERNLAAEEPGRLEALRIALEDWLQHNGELAEQVGSLPYHYEESEALRRHLEKLGYV